MGKYVITIEERIPKKPLSVMEKARRGIVWNYSMPSYYLKQRLELETDIDITDKIAQLVAESRKADS